MMYTFRLIRSASPYPALRRTAANTPPHPTHQRFPAAACSPVGEVLSLIVDVMIYCFANQGLKQAFNCDT
jgi:hypothetical protein